MWSRYPATDRMPSHLCLAHDGPGLMEYQSGARIVRRAQEQAAPEYIRPDTAASKAGGDARRRFESTTMSAGVSLI
jgi:hypothetical protein